MSLHPASVGGRGDAAELRQELLGRLGLRADASDQDVETAHNGLVEFLEVAPKEMRSWAEAQTAGADEAFALLSGPEQDLVAAAQAVPDEASPALSSAPAATARPPAPPAPAARPAPPAPQAAPVRRPRQPQLVWAIAVVAIVAIVFAVSRMDNGSAVPGISGTPTGQQTTAPSGGATATPIDQTKLVALMTKIAANPRDLVSLQGLGDLYFASTDYKNASTFERKVLAVDPKNKAALIALGVAQFNLGNTAEAKKHWLVAAGLYPKLAEVHYDLGFLYLSQSPPDTANMKVEWNKVIAIDPTSDLAKTVGNHLKSATSTATASPSAK